MKETTLAHKNFIPGERYSQAFYIANQSRRNRKRAIDESRRLLIRWLKNKIPSNYLDMSKAEFLEGKAFDVLPFHLATKAGRGDVAVCIRYTSPLKPIKPGDEG